MAPKPNQTEENKKKKLTAFQGIKFHIIIYISCLKKYLKLKDLIFITLPSRAKEIAQWSARCFAVGLKDLIMDLALSQKYHLYAEKQNLKQEKGSLYNKL